MKKTILNICLASLLSAAAFGQDFNQYKPLACKGSIPKEYITSSTEKYKREIQQIEADQTQRKEAMARKQFALETNFALDDLLQSGLVLFNDDVTVYLNEVMATLLQHSSNKTVVEKVKVYALRSPSVNAFATDRGHIFVTLGLLAQLENEAQLAYILSHELVHVEEGHSLELFLDTKAVNKKSGSKEVLAESIFDEDWVARCAYSKELENEADLKGLTRFQNTAYSTATLNTVFDVLKYSYLPFDDVAFSKTFFDDENYKLPTGYWLEQVNSISGEDEDSDDRASTHPNIGNRRKTLNESLATQGVEQGKSNFIVSEERFNNLRKITRYEMPMLHLHRDEWPDAIYTAYLLLKDNPSSSYLQKCIAKALYLQTLAENGEYTNENTVAYGNVEGESQQVFAFLEKIKEKELNVLALRYTYALSRHYPDDSELAGMLEGLFLVLAENFENLSEFNTKAQLSTEATASPAPTAPADSTVAQKQSSKYDKIREQKSRKALEPAGPEYWRNAFLDFIEEEAFKTGFEDAKKEKDRRRQLDEHFSTSKGRREWRKKENARKMEGLHLGIKKIVVVNPYYLQLDIRNGTKTQYIPTEVGQVRMHEIIEELAPKTKLELELLDVSDMKEEETEQFNDIRFLKEWFSEQANHFDMPLTLGTNQAQVNAIAEKYGTDYFLWTGTVSLRQKTKGGADIFYGILFYPYLPFAIFKAVKPNYGMLHYSILYDVRTGRREVLKFDYFSKKNSEAMTKAHLFDTFNQINSEPKEKEGN